MRLMDYFNNVEKEIANEVANRKANIASVRAQMARDFAFNAKARSQLKKAMLHKMAVNAEICRKNLARAMRQTQEKFAKKAALDNKRQKATEARDRQTLKIANFRHLAKKGRSKLAAQLAAQDKASRQYA